MITGRMLFTTCACEFPDITDHKTRVLPDAMNNMHTVAFVHSGLPLFVAIGISAPISWGRPPDII
ncbi:hypothetical protein KDW_08230 [Dictyobacter vulcani]|uniref:Uncharacterized protein n=1 Tax=Dictyobacter vulcani TaxID=2607529 RepID=A0A5J4KKF1_9CHLR|nr:hypothetical protein [Dictyobacter vulcani]GER86661.1 hypothetical protein KDW_08230 [Dictyobacter vulcani]